MNLKKFFPIILQNHSIPFEKVSNENRPQPQYSFTSSNVFNSFFQNHPDVIFIVSREGRVLSMNRTGFGYMKRKVLNRFFRDFFPDAVKKEIEAVFLSTLEGNTMTCESVFLNHDGTKSNVQISCIPYIHHGDIIGVIGTIKDITLLKEREKQVVEIQSNLNTAQRIANIGSWDYDVINNEAFWSSQVYKIYNIDPQSDFVPTYERILEFVHPSDRERFKQLVQTALVEGKGYSTEYRLAKGGEEGRYVFEQADIILDQNGKPMRIIGTIQDITSQKQTESQLKESQEQFQMIADNVDLTIWSVDPRTKQVVFLSKGARDLFGVELDELYDNRLSWTKFVHPEDLPLISEKQLGLHKGNKISYEYRMIDKFGKLKWISEQTIPILDNSGEIIRVDGIMKDITEEKYHTEKLEFIANHDYLTKLPNRRFFEMKLKEHIGKAKGNQSFAVFYLDLDRFKYINDSLGHDIGDQLLISVSDRIQEFLEDGAFLARLGGDEFSFYINTNGTIESSIEVAKKIVAALERPFYVNDFELYVTTSVGISLYPYNGEGVNELLKNADIALYKAKELGKNGWQIYSPSMNIEAYKHHQLEMDLHKAVINSELYIEYQPKVETKTGKLKGAEALIRWNHPEWGRVAPGEFIPIAEESGLIHAIEDWVIEHVCRCLSNWENTGKDVVPISINVSPTRLQKADFIEKIVRIFEETNVNRSLIEFELTETGIIMNEDKVRQVISKLKETGVRFSLDDFGTGFSSISYLKDFQIDVLKIDKSFINGITKEGNTEKIIKGIINMATELGIDVVAEGVETNAQFHFLKNRNCHLIQGYLFSKSLSEREFCKLFQKERLYPTPEKSKMTIENRRKHYRVNLPKPLLSEITISSFKGKKVTLGHSKVLVEDIGIGGLRITSNIDFPVSSDILLEVIITMNGHEVRMVGFIVWKQEIENQLHQYGLQYVLPQHEQDKIAAYVNQLTVHLRNSSAPAGYHFLLDTDRQTFFM